MPGRPEVIAHRGTPREHPENSLPGFAHALALGADALELDVHVSADGVPVVHHDAELHGGSLDGRAIAGLPSAAVLGHELAAGVRVPTLAEVLRLADGRATVYVEVKARDGEAHVAAVVAPYGAAAPVHSFDHRIPRAVAAHAPGVPCGILSTCSLVDTVAALRAAGARDLWQHWSMVDAALVEAVHAAGGRVIVWTANEAATIAACAELGVDGICSDLPQRVAEVLAGHRATTGGGPAPTMRQPRA